MHVDNLKVGQIYYHSGERVRITATRHSKDHARYCFIIYSFVDKSAWGAAFTHINNTGFVSAPKVQAV